MTPQEYEKALAEDIAGFYADPLGFVMYVYPWGQAGTPLENFDGPDDWQRDFLNKLGQQIKERNFDGVHAVDPILFAVSSGHGIGKSCVTAWLIHFIMSTRPMARGVVTANSVPQLEDKTWPEMAKWKKMAINSHWFDKTGSRGNLKLWQPAHPENWKTTGLANRKENSEAFAGLHNASSTAFYIFDEASAIDDAIWEVSEGGLTDGEPMWFCFGNPTRNTGRFRECFGRFKHRWTTFQIDSRQAKMTNKEKIQQWIDDYGINSDFIKIRVLGEFPGASERQFIRSDLVQTARERDLLPDAYRWQPIVISVDVARFGSDQTVICIRQGLKLHELRKFRGLDTQQVASRTMEACREYQEGLTPVIMVDDVGVGGGVTDCLRSLGYIVNAVNAGTVPTDREMYFNKRAEMWGRMRQWLRDGGDIPDDNELAEQLISPEYDFTPKQQIRLERKADMKARGLASPDCGDALAISFAEYVSPDFGEDSYEPEEDYDFED